MPVPIPGRVAEAVRRSTVQVRSENHHQNGHGSGGAIAPDQIITNAHVIQGPDIVVESWEGKSATASVTKLDRRRDLALLSVHGLDTPPLTLFDSDLVRPGTPVIAVGNPLGFIGAVSSGVVHAIGPLRAWNARVASTGHSWIHADVRLAPGNSGGPLANLHGQLVGVNTMIISGGIALAIPSRAVQSFLARKNSALALGVVVRPVRLPDRELAMLILELVSGGAAEQASLLPGDLLLTANGRRFRFTDDLQAAIDEAADASLHLEFRRGGKPALRHVVAKLTPDKVVTAA